MEDKRLFNYTDNIKEEKSTPFSLREGGLKKNN